MRAFILMSIAILVGGPAFASSIETVVSSAAKGPSIVKISCATCPAPKTKEEISGYRVPSLPAGTQDVEIREVDGKKKLMRTEAWMGGSPVTYVSQSAMWLDDKGTALAGAKPSGHGDGIDVTAQTSAVIGGEAEPRVAAMSGPAAEPPALDISGFELRLN